MTQTEGSLHGRARESVSERAVALGLLAGRRVAERDVRVERRMLEARRRLDGGDDLPRHTELREAAKRRLLVRAEVPDGLVEADHALLHEVVPVAAGEEVRARLQANEPGVLPHETHPVLPYCRFEPGGRAAGLQALVELSERSSVLWRFGRPSRYPRVCAVVERISIELPRRLVDQVSR